MPIRGGSTPAANTVQPPPSTFASSSMSEMGTIHEDEDGLEDEHTASRDGSTRQTQETGRRPSIPRTPKPIYPMHSGGQIPTSRSLDSVTKALNRPKRLSNSSSASSASSTTSGATREGRAGFSRSASWSSTTTFESVESVGWRSASGFHGKNSSISLAASSKASTSTTLGRWETPDAMFASMPSEVLELIMAKLKLSHLGRNSESCATCWMRDLCSMSVCNHRWSTLARLAMYEDIQLVGADSATHRKKYKMAEGSRMLMLRQTLRALPHLAAVVRSLKVPRPDVSVKESGTKNILSIDQYEDLVASLVMACPNLEKLSAPIRGYDHTFRKVYHAISTRPSLKKMHWAVEASTTEKSRKSKPTRSETNTPTELLPSQAEAFLSLHDRWTHLESLTIHCLRGATLAPDTLLVRTVDQLPALQHLHLSNLPPNSFDDSNLLSLPALESLTLSNITGITANGLSAFATGPSSASLCAFHLRHVPMTELNALARVFSNLTQLTNFSLIQTFPPLMPEEDSFTLCIMPYLASNSLSKLHWDITSHSSVLNAADDVLSRSIAAGGFPALRTLRAPNDPNGVFQDLCRPRFRIDLPHDKYHNTLIARANTEPTFAPKSPMKLLRRTTDSPTHPPGTSAPPLHSNLCASRLAAQARIETAWTKPRFTVNVIEEDGTTEETFGVGAFIGTLGSPIDYHLYSDPDSTDEKGGIVSVEDTATDGGELLVGGRVGCTGSWNRVDGEVADKKEKERWWHTERGRWMGVELD